MRKERFIIKHNNLLLRSFIMTLFIVFILLIIVNRLVYLSFSRIHMDNVKNEKTKEIQVVADRLSQTLKDLDTIAYSILTNNKTAPHVIDRGGYSGIVATKEILNHQVGNSFIEEILLYTRYNNRNLLTSSSSICDIDIALSYKYGCPNSTKDRIDNIILTNYSPVLLSTESLVGDLLVDYFNANYKDRILYISPPNVQSLYKNSAVLFLIQEETLQSFAEQAMTGYNGYFYLFNKENKSIYSFQVNENAMDAEAFLSRLDLTSDEPGGQTVEIGDISYTVLQEHLASHPYSMMLVIPTSQYLMPMEEWMNSFITILLVLLVCGVGIAIMITIANYLPIYNSTRALSHFTNLSQGPSIGKELPYLSTALVALSNQNMNLQKKNQELSIIRRREFLTNLFKDNYLESDIRSLITTADMVIIESFFAVLCVGIDNFNDFQRVHSKDMQLLLKECIITQCEKTLSGVGNAYGVELGEAGIFAVLFNAESKEIAAKDLNMLSQKLVTSFADDFDISITVGISLRYFDIKDTGSAYTKAREALDFRLIYGASKVIPYSSIMVNYSNSSWYPVLLEQKLLDAINTLETKKISNILNQLIQEFHEKNLTIKKVQFICCSLIGSFISFMSQMNIETDSDFFEVQHLFINFQFETLDEVQHHLDKLVKITCKYISNQQSQKENTLIDEILQFINDNYDDCELCLQSIADHFNYSVSYISRVFKEHTGYTLISYVDNIRMQKAKQLLRETDYSITQSLTLVGYNDKNNFIRKFRRLEGITPMQYRKDYQSRLMYILND
jgi:two-component system response regulator YesN